jgi:hypothetical protein
MFPHLSRHRGIRDGDRKRRPPGRDAERGEQAQVDFDDVTDLGAGVHPLAPRVVNVGVEGARQRLPGVFAVEPEHARRPGQPRHDRRLQQSLEIDCDIVAAPPQLPDRRQQGGPAPARLPIVHRHPAVDHRHQLEDLPVLRAHQPIDPRGRVGAAQGRGHRDGVHDVAKGTEFDDQDSQGWSLVLVARLHWSPLRAMRASSSLVA